MGQLCYKLLSLGTSALPCSNDIRRSIPTAGMKNDSKIEITWQIMITESRRKQTVVGVNGENQSHMCENGLNTI